MSTLIVTNGLQTKYYLSNFLWNLCVKRILKMIAFGWRLHPLISYPLLIDIELGNMKLRYFKYGFIHVMNRVSKYNIVLAHRLEGREEEEFSMEDFMRKVKLTKEADIEAQLERELTETDLKYY